MSNGLSYRVEDVLDSATWSSIKYSLTSRVYDVVDFFSGCGGMSYGFHSIGEKYGSFRHIGAFDIDIHTNLTFKRNFGQEPHNIDLGQAKSEDIKNLLATKRDKRNPLIVIGCAPCQGFSSHRKKDPRKDSRNSLVAKFANIAVSLDAEIIIMENVPDLLSAKHWHHYEAFKNVIEDGGYKITSQIINAAEYGVPQERFRAVVLATKNFIPTLPEPILKRPSFKTVRDAIGHLPPLKAGEFSERDPLHITSKHKPETVQIIKQIPKDGGSRPPGVGPECLDRVAGFFDVYGRLWWDKPAITLTARCRTPSCGRFVHPEQDRGLSVREAGLLQGFPPDFIFEGPFDDKFKQIGNAVPPILSLHLATHILKMLAGLCHGKTEQQITEPRFKSYSSVIAHLKLKDNVADGGM